MIEIVKCWQPFQIHLNSYHIKSESKGEIELSKQVSLRDKIFQGNHKVAYPPNVEVWRKFYLFFIRQISRKQSHHWFENKEKRAHD